MNLMTMIGVSILFLASALLFFVSGYIVGRIKTMKQLTSLDSFLNLKKNIKEVIGEVEE